MKHLLLIILTSTNLLYSLPPHFQTTDYWAESTLQQLTLRQKIGQLFMVATAANLTQQEEKLASALVECPYKMDHDYIEQLIGEYHIGGIIFLFKSKLEEQITLMNRFQQMSALPLLIGQDCEWGLSMHLYDMIRFPHNMTLGAIQDPALLYELGKQIGKQCKAIGIHINFAPVVDINNNPKNPVINDRSFGDDKQMVSDYGTLIMKGMQDAGILACAKHFPGHGDTTIDSHVALPTIFKSKKQLLENELYPFKKLIDAGVAAIMNGHLQIPALDPTGLPASLSETIVSNILKKELGFKGLVITDGLGMKALTENYEPGYIELYALCAGNDIILCPLDVPKAVKLIEQAISDGRFSEEELNERVLKILRSKEKLFKQQSPFIDFKLAQAEVNTNEAYAVKYASYRQAITLVKNHKHIIPLDPEDYKNTSVIQIGGYLPSTFETHLKNRTNLTTYHVPAEMSQTQFDSAAQSASESKIVIIGLFDMNKLTNQNWGIAKKTLKLIKKLKNEGKKIIVVPFGNPYSLSLFENGDALLMPYEDDPDAQEAAAEIITGTLKSRGRLPVLTEQQS